MNKAFVFSLIWILIFGAVFTCCVMPMPMTTAEASVLESDCEHHEKDSLPSDVFLVDCSCPQALGLNVKSFSLDASDQLVLNNFLNAGWIENLNLPDFSFLDTDAGPPLSESPLYIKHSVLRI